MPYQAPGEADPQDFIILPPASAAGLAPGDKGRRPGGRPSRGHDENDRVALEGLESAPSYDKELLA